MTRKKRTTRKPRSKKTSRSGFSWWWLPVLLAVMALAGVWWLGLIPLGFGGGSVSRSSVESVFMGAGLDLDRSVVFKETDAGSQHWKVDIQGEALRGRVIRSLTHLFEGKGYDVEDGGKEVIDGRNHALMSARRGGEQIFFLFVLEESTRVAKKPSSGKPYKPFPHKRDEVPSQVAQEVGITKPRIAIILDDVGGKPPRALEPILDLNFPITFSVLPFLAHSSQVATFLHQHHYEVMLHLPMEPKDFPRANPGPGAIYSHMSEHEIRKTIADALDSVPFAVGVNNHMGSKITANRALISTVLDEIKQRNLFFVDSRTHDSTIAFEVARQTGLLCGERKVFLDAETTYEFTVQQLNLACEKADEEGAVIAIGHPHESTLRALVDRLPLMDQQGYVFCFARDLLTVDAI